MYITVKWKAGWRLVKSHIFSSAFSPRSNVNWWLAPPPSHPLYPPGEGHVCPAVAGEESPRSVNISPPTHFTIQQILEMGEALILFRLRCAASRSRVWADAASKLTKYRKTHSSPHHKMGARKYHPPQLGPAAWPRLQTVWNIALLTFRIWALLGTTTSNTMDNCILGADHNGGRNLNNDADIPSGLCYVFICLRCMWVDVDSVHVHV